MVVGETSPGALSPAEPGKRVAHYEILEEVGRGGMGIVYRARDLKLGRRVALKCPWPTPPTGSRERRRFLREARAAARLSHPHIVPIFEVLEDQGVPWLAMDLVEGTTLRAILAPRRPLPVAEIVCHAEGLASALQAAHDHGILHGDVSPNNVMVTNDGRAILTDFGLARFLQIPEGSSTRTRDSDLGEERRAAGTLRYMSPEQTLGKPLDARSDIFSLGAVLYEMCTGEPAFAGSGPEVIDAILHREPVPISRLNYEVPERLEQIVRKTLAKHPRDRYQDIRDLLVDLRTVRREVDRDYVRPTEPSLRAIRERRWMVAGAAAAAALLTILALRFSSTTTTPSPRPVRLRLAILPHHDVSHQPTAAGWPELIQALFVRELTGTEQFGVLDPLTLNGLLEGSFGTRQPIRGRSLYDALRSVDVAFVVDGMVTASKSGYRLQSNLVAVPSGEVEFSEGVVLSGEDGLPEAVASLSNRIVAFLQINVLRVARDKELRPWLPERPKNLEAVKAFVQGTEYEFRYEPGAGRYFERAVALDPTFVSPRVWLISALVMGDRLDQAREHYRYLQQIESASSPFEQALIEWAGAYISGDFAAQARHLDVALQYSPDNNVLLVTLAEARFRMDDFAGALQALAPPLQKKWRYPNLYTLQGVCLIGLGRYDESNQSLKSAMGGGPVDPDVYGMLAALAWQREDAIDAVRFRDLYVTRSRQVGAPDAAIQEGLSGHLIRVGLYDKAIPYLRDAMAADDRTLGYHDYLTTALYKSGQVEKVMNYYLARLRADPRWPDGHLMLGRIRDRRGATAQAIQHYETFVSLEPEGAASQGVRHRLAALQKPQSPGLATR